MKPAAAQTRRWPRVLAVLSAIVLCAVAGLTYSKWFPAIQRLVKSRADEQHPHDEHGDEHPDHDHEHGHDHEGHQEENSVELSVQAQQNIDLKTAKVALQRFERTISVPGLIVERPGRSQVNVTAPVGGQVTRIYHIQGDAVMPNDVLFEQRLTHEELVTAQSELLRAAEELDVIKREIERLASVNVPGAIAGKTVREREYEQQKLAAVINAQRQSLILHGLSSDQVDRILKDRKLLQGLAVVTPAFSEDGHENGTDHPFHVHELKVRPGDYVDAGSSLCILADHHELFIEGRAFEQEIEHLNKAVREGVAVSADLVASGRLEEPVKGLKIFYLSDSVDVTDRMFPFFIRLSNKLIRDVKDDSGHRFVEWKYKPGQRMQVHIPIETWDERVVLPISAIAQDGAEIYVFEQNGDHFDRVPVHVEYRDDRFVVIENDGRLLGSTVAVSGAQQLHLALKNKSGAALDPHAGHSH